jgi:hypothetical protein
MTDPIILTGTVSNETGTITADVELVQTTEPPPAKLPDLIVTAVRVADPPAPWSSGDPLLIAATVQNLGAPILPGVIIGVAFYFGTPDPARVRGLRGRAGSDPPALACWTWSDSYADGLESGAEIELVANGGFAGPTFPACGPTLAIQARIDDPSDVSRILESNENNNRLAITIDVDQPDPPTPPDPPDPPTPGVHASAQLTVADFPTDGPAAPNYLRSFMAPLQADGQRAAPAIAQNLGGGTPDEFLSRAWAIASNDPQWGQDWLRRGQRIAVTIPIAWPPGGVEYWQLTDAMKRQALLDTANGANDNLFRQAVAYFTAAVPNPGPLIDSRVGHEPDATWYCWSIAGGIDAYHAAQQHVLPLWRQLMPDTRIVFNMDGALDRNFAWASVPYGTGEAQTELIFGPLREHCQIVAADIYYSGNDPGFVDVTKKFDYLLAWSNDWQLPAVIPEWGLDSVDWPDAIDHWRANIERFADGQLLYHCYFDGWEPAALRTKPNTKARFYSLDGFAT